MYEIDYGIPMEELVNRRVYKVLSRNLLVGAWDAERNGFIGVRMKFKSKYLFTEFHWDADPRLGTAHALEDLGIEIPDEIPMQELLHLECRHCGAEVKTVMVEDAEFKAKNINGGMKSIGNRHLVDTDCTPEETHFAQWKENQPLFDLLLPWDEKFHAEDIEEYPGRFDKFR